MATKRNKKELIEDFHDIIRVCIETEKLYWDDIQILLNIATLLEQSENDFVQINKKLQKSRSTVRYLSKELNYYKETYEKFSYKGPIKKVTVQEKINNDFVQKENITEHVSSVDTFPTKRLGLLLFFLFCVVGLLFSGIEFKSLFSYNTLKYLSIIAFVLFSFLSLLCSGQCNEFCESITKLSLILIPLACFIFLSLMFF